MSEKKVLSLNDDGYLLDLLTKNRLLTTEQRSLVESRQAQQRQLFLRQHSARRKTDTDTAVGPEVARRNRKSDFKIRRRHNADQ